MKRSIVFSIVLVVVTFYNACSDVRLMPRTQFSSLSTDFGGSFCTLNMTSTSGIKFYFIMDVTGSNANPSSFEGTNIDPTDPGKPGPTNRSNAMTSIAQKYPEAKIALQTFASDQAGQLVENYFDFAISQDFIDYSINGPSGFNSIEDYGGTVYDAPLRSALNHIKDYLNAQAMLPREARDPWGPLIIVFASDGIPNVGQYDQATLRNLSLAIVNIVNSPQYQQLATQLISQIIINTAGYGGVFQTGSTSSSQYLQWISESNNGIFANLGTGPFDLSVFAPAPQKASGVLDKIYATNLSVVWEPTTTGKAELKWDADNDGISDDREKTLGSFKEKLDSDKDMISDGVANLLVPGAPCALPGCQTPTTAQNNPQNPVWNRCLSISATEGGGSGYLTGDIMNNCEKLALQLDYRKFSNANDNIPDGIKVRAGFSPLDARLSQADSSNVTVLDKIMANQPSWLSQNQIVASGIPATTYDVQFTGKQADGRSCYSFRVNHLPVINNGLNKVRIWLTQTDIYKRDMLRTVDVMVYSATDGVQVSDEQFLPNQSQVPQ